MKAATIHPNTKLAAMIFCSLVMLSSVYHIAKAPCKDKATDITYHHTNKIKLYKIHTTASVLNDATL